MKQFLIAPLFLLAFTFHSLGQSYIGYRIGDAVTDFALPNISDLHKVSLHNQSEVVVVLFTSNDCAYSRLYEARVKALQAEFSSQGVSFLMINSNYSSGNTHENADAMRKRMQDNKWLIPYLCDSLGIVSRTFGATRLPHAFVLKKMDTQYRLVYKGAIDDNPQSPDEVVHRFLRDAIVAMVQKKSIKVSETRPVGCIVKN